jgi:hypothetical protein
MHLRTLLIVLLSLLVSPSDALAWNRIEILTLEIDSVTVDGRPLADLSDYPVAPPAQVRSSPAGFLDALELTIARNATPCGDGILFGCGVPLAFVERYYLDSSIDGGAP